VQLQKNINLIVVSFSTYLQVPAVFIRNFSIFSISRQKKIWFMVPVDFNESLALILLDVLVLVSIALLPAAAFSVLIYMNHHGLFIVYFKG